MEEVLVISRGTPMAGAELLTDSKGLTGQMKAGAHPWMADKYVIGGPAGKLHRWCQSPITGNNGGKLEKHSQRMCRLLVTTTKVRFDSQRASLNRTVLFTTTIFTGITFA